MWSGDGSTLLCVVPTQSLVEVFSLKGGHVRLAHGEAGVSSAEFAENNGNRVVTVTADRVMVTAWDVISGEVVLKEGKAAHVGPDLQPAVLKDTKDGSYLSFLDTKWNLIAVCTQYRTAYFNMLGTFFSKLIIRDTL